MLNQEPIVGRVPCGSTFNGQNLYIRSGDGDRDITTSYDVHWEEVEAVLPHQLPTREMVKTTFSHVSIIDNEEEQQCSEMSPAPSLRLLLPCNWKWWAVNFWFLGFIHWSSISSSSTSQSLLRFSPGFFRQSETTCTWIKRMIQDSYKQVKIENQSLYHHGIMSSSHVHG